MYQKRTIVVRFWHYTFLAHYRVACNLPNSYKMIMNTPVCGIIYRKKNLKNRKPKRSLFSMYIMTQFEYLAQLNAEKSITVSNIQMLHQLTNDGDQRILDKAFKKYYTLKAKCATIYKAFMDGTLDPDAEMSDVMFD